MRRSLLFAALVLGWLLAGMVAAVADPPGPTDYLSEVTAIEPEVAGIQVEIVGGDSFFLLTVAPGVRVDVVGYSGEPYLRFSSDGTVEENQASPSKYLNEDRYAITEIPDTASADADPEWKVVATDGSYAWHDHRTHWMNEMKPPGKGPGDQVVEGVIPLFVDGVEVDVTVASVWQEPPSALSVVLGITAGLLLGFAVIRRRGPMLHWMIVGAALVALGSGAVAYFSVPGETAPTMTMWLVPATAAVLALVAIYRQSLGDGSRRILLLIAALEVVAWSIAHWGWLWPAVLPTSLPFWLDRFIGAGVLVTAMAAAVAVLLTAAAPPRQVSFRPR